MNNFNILLPILKRGFFSLAFVARTTIVSLILFNVASAREFATCAGRVSDANGSVIVGVRVEFTELDTKVSIVEVTDRKGEFRFPRLNQGSYRVTASADGFEDDVRTVEIDAAVSLEIVLQPRNVAEVVSVDSTSLAGTAEALGRTAGSFQTIDKAMLETSRVISFSEALRKVSGINTRDEEGLGLRPNISIRGTNPTRSTKVLLLEDGMPLSYAPYGDNASYYHPPIERFESIEVLKGSGQIEYGPVTVAGVINYVTPNPTARPSFSLKVTGGNRGYLSGSAGFSNTFGRTGVIVNFTRKQSAGARDNVRSRIYDFSSKVFQPLDDRNILTAKFSWYGEDSNVTYSGLTEDEYRNRPRANPFRNDFFYANRFGTSLSHTAVFTPKISLTTNFFVNNFSRHWWRQSSNSDERPNALGRDPDCRGMQDLNSTCGNQGRLRNYWVVGVEPRLIAEFDIGSIRNEFKAGFRYQYEDQNRVQKNGDLPNSRDGVVVENGERNVNALAGFVQNRFIWKNLSVTPGLRVENVRYSRTNRLAANGNGISRKKRLTEIIPGLGLAYNLFGNLTVFTGLHRGFAPPAVADVISNNGSVVELDSERSWNFEAGFRSRPVAGIKLEGTYFRTDYENQIVPQSVAGGIGSTVTNGGRTFHQGFEVFTRIDSADLFQTGFNIYFHTNYTRLAEAAFRGIRFSAVNGFTNVPVSGNRLPYTPRVLSTSSVGYAYKQFDGFLEVNYIGKQFSDDLNRIGPVPNGQAGLIPSQTYLNATANYHFENLHSTFFVTAKNLSDRLFIVDRSRGILPGSPRLVQFGWKWSFGH